MSKPSTPRQTTVLGRFNALPANKRVIMGVVLMGISLIGLSISPDPGDDSYKERMAHDDQVRAMRGGGGLIVPPKP